MTSRGRRPIVALAAALLTAGLALGPLVAGELPVSAVAATPAADATATPISVTLTTLRPIAPQPGNTLVVTGQLRNTSDQSIQGLAVQLKVGLPIGSRGEFDNYAADPDAALPPDVQDSLITSAPAPVGPTALAPGATEPFRVTLGLDTPTAMNLPLTDMWEVRPLGIAVTDTSTIGDGQPAGQLDTFLPWAPRSTAAANGVPTGVAWIWPLADRPHRSATGGWADDALAPALSPNGRLDNLVAAGAAAESQRGPGKHPTTRNVPVTWAIDPMLVSNAEAMSKPYQVSVGSKLTPGKGTRAATTWVQLLRGAVTQRDAAVLPLPFADPDVVAAVRVGLATALGLATTTGKAVLEQAFGAISLLSYGWPPGGLADQRAINALVATGDTAVVLSNAALPQVSADVLPYTPTARATVTTSAGSVPAVLTDSVLSADVSEGAANPGDSAVALQRFLAETLMIHAELPGSVGSPARDVVIAPSRRWNPSASYAAALLADTGKVPWIAPVPLKVAARTQPVTPVDRQPLTYPASAFHNELSATYLGRLAGVRAKIATFSAILPPGSTATRVYATTEEQALSSAWRQNGTLANRRLDGLKAAVDQQMSQVQIASHVNSYVTLTSHRGKVPVTVSNNLDTPVNVTVQVKSNQRLTLSDHGLKPVAVPAHQQTLVYVRAAAKTSGVFPVKVQLLTPRGAPYGGQVQLFVRSTVYGTITLIITGAATAALMVAVAIRLSRRAFAARRAATA